MNTKYKYIGLTPAFGKIYKKGKAHLVIYSDGEKKYWPDFEGNWEQLFKRNKNGMYQFER